MFIHIDPNEKRRKLLCDILEKERIKPIDSFSEAINFAVKNISDISLIIAEINVLYEIHEKAVMEKIYQKFGKKIPVVSYYEKEDEKVKFIKSLNKYKLIKYDKDDPNFCTNYTNLIKEVFPALKVKDNEIEDVRQWLKEQNFIKETLPQEPLQGVKAEIQEPLKNIDEFLMPGSVSKNKLLKQEVEQLQEEKITEKEKYYQQLLDENIRLKEENKQLREKYEKLRAEYLKSIEDLKKGLGGNEMQIKTK